MKKITLGRPFRRDVNFGQNAEKEFHIIHQRFRKCLKFKLKAKNDSKIFLESENMLNAKLPCTTNRAPRSYRNSILKTKNSPNLSQA